MTSDPRAGVPQWRKSSFSVSTGECVELAWLEDGVTVGIRDSKDPEGAVLRFSPDAFEQFAADIQAGRFDELR